MRWFVAATATAQCDGMRNLVCDEAGLAGLRPENEKAGLLPQRPESDGLPTAADERRRSPADVWLPSGGEAWDFACAAGLRTDMMERVILRASAVFAEYENLKCSFKDTDQLCQPQGFVFTPTIAKAHSGARSPAARKMFDVIAQRAATASSTFTTPELESLRFAQRLSVTLRGENACARPQGGWQRG